MGCVRSSWGVTHCGVAQGRAQSRRRGLPGLTRAPLPQLSLNNKQLTQMLKSSAPVQEQEEDPLAYYENHTSQIEVGPEGPGA